MPVYNEGANVGRALEEIYANVPSAEARAGRLRLRRGRHRPGRPRAAGRAIPGVELVKNTLGRGVLNAVRAGIAATTAEVVVDHDGRPLRRRRGRPQDGRTDPRRAATTSSAPRATCRAAGRSAGPRLKKFLSRAAGVSLHWLAGPADPRRDQRLPRLPPRVLRRDPDREPGGLRVLAGDHRQGVRRGPAGSPRSPRPGATARPGSPGSSSGPGFRSTCNGMCSHSPTGPGAGGSPETRKSCSRGGMRRLPHPARGPGPLIHSKKRKGPGDPNRPAPFSISRSTSMLRQTPRLGLEPRT